MISVKDIKDIPTEQIPAILAELAAIQTALAARLLNVQVQGNGKLESPPQDDRLLTAEQASEILGVKPRWLYRHAVNLPFARKLSRKTLRFSENGVRKYQAIKRA